MTSAFPQPMEGVKSLAQLNIVQIATPVMAHLPRWEMCWPSWNLSSFLTWFHHHASGEEQRGVSCLYMVKHCREDGPVVAGRRIVAKEVNPQLSWPDGTVRDIPQRMCKEVDCKRCEERLGGYMFRWVDARWTPRAAMDLSIPAERMPDEMYKPWPHGLRMVKNSQVQSTASSAVACNGFATDAAKRRAALPSPSQVRAWSVCALPEPSGTPEELGCSQSPYS